METLSSLVNPAGQQLLFEMEIELHTAYTFVLHPIVCLKDLFFR